ncbi:phosphatase domain-containing putative toxin [Marinobacter orientalis]|uniref:ATP-binding cassette domain-containing protein n=1 Tax=Marinobacter orientalis TaxID=1928859 RepID=A0A7Y0NJH3_9GAMM|nr:ATP-binding cassette domain-containing protein [Marinobacter orientalis]NMT62304.1 ATP-binding cassette domain-containing protein [Marinobacter orientalis]TGX51011.1 ATP-binding cassette domain-containing protein [Marinobacter orientalis]
MNNPEQDTSNPSVLSLVGFGVAFREKTVLASIDLEVPDRQITILLGPSGTGKSTLLRTLAGFNDPNPNLRTWGSVNYAGAPLGDGERPVLAAQNARMVMASILENIIQDLPERRSLSPIQQRHLAQRLLENAGLQELVERIDEPVIHLDLAQQRHLATMRLAATGARLILLDEPTTGLNDQEAGRLLDYIAAEGQRRSILIALHNLSHASILGGRMVLIAGGTVHETAETCDFLGHPVSDAGRSFVKSGSCAVAAPDADPETLAPETPAPPPLPEEALSYVSDSFGPRGFLWLKKGKLAGTPRPGIVQDLEYDLRALKRVGITTLITLTETKPDTEALAEYGIENIWSPFRDMAAPSITQAAGLCKMIQRLCDEGGVVAVHCRAGLGRTGTILACCLIWEGMAALDSLETVRRTEPRWVQSEAQVEFLEKFALFLTERVRNAQAS